MKMDSEPLPPSASARESEQQENEKKLPIKTYHCRFCSHLLIASTREILSSRTPLRRRRVATGSAIEGGGGGEGGLDGALILELPSLSSRSSKKESRKRKSYDGEEEWRDTIPEPEAEKEVASTVQAAASTQAASAAAAPSAGETRKTEQAHYTIPLSTLLPDQTPIIVRREDGFEKRILLRCGRCRVVVGYKLCDAAGSTTEAEDIDVDVDDEDEEDGEELGLTRGGKGEKAIYLLPGSIVGTEDLDVGVDGTGGNVLNAMVERNPVLKGMEGEWMEWIK